MKTQNMKGWLQEITTLAALVCFLFSPCTSSEAAVIAYDGFSSSDYTAAGLNGQNPTIAGFSGAWAASGGTVGTASPPALTYAGVASDNTGGVYNASTGENGRTLSPALSGESTYYISLMMQYSATPGTDYRAFELYNDATRVLQVGVNCDIGSSNVWGMRAANSASYIGLTDVAVSAGTTAFAVIKLTLSATANAASATMWIDPTDLSSEAGSVTHSTSLSGFTLSGVTMVNLSAWGLSGPTYWDELRIGTTWADVTTVPEPATWALLAFSLTGIVIFRRRAGKRMGWGGSAERRTAWGCVRDLY